MLQSLPLTGQSCQVLHVISFEIYKTLFDQSNLELHCKTGKPKMLYTTLCTKLQCVCKIMIFRSLIGLEVTQKDRGTQVNNSTFILTADIVFGALCYYQNNHTYQKSRLQALLHKKHTFPAIQPI